MNQYLTENYDDGVLPFVALEGFDFVAGTIFNPTVLLATTTPSQTALLPIWVIVVIVAGGVFIVGLVIVLTWYYCRKSKAANLAQNEHFEQPTLQ